jgi:glycine betaine/proline transport system ATP-binding protein
MVFQQFGLMPWRTVLENVAYPLEIQGVERASRNRRAEEKLELVGLSSWKNSFPAELSGGMQQRVGLARAFVTDAEVLLMDEPFSALDPIHRKNLQDEILQLQKRLKKTIVFVTHDFAEAQRLADRIAVMQSGRVLQVDVPEELIRNPACEGVSEFVDQGGEGGYSRGISKSGNA